MDNCAAISVDNASCCVSNYDIQYMHKYSARFCCSIIVFSKLDTYSIKKGNERRKKEKKKKKKKKKKEEVEVVEVEMEILEKKVVTDG